MRTKRHVAEPERMMRQGDVLVRRVSTRVPSGTDLRERGRIVLAHGEVTGHAHEVIVAETLAEPAGDAAAFFEEPDGRRFLFVTRTCHLVHQEHGRIMLPPGAYEVLRQREYEPSGLRNVAD